MPHCNNCGVCVSQEEWERNNGLCDECVFNIGEEDESTWLWNEFVPIWG